MSATALLTAVSVVAKKKVEEEIYRAYVTETLKIISSNTAKINGGSTITKSYQDIISTEKRRQKTTDEVISDLEKSGAITIRKGE